jgi:pimeloyl-ACP methyl ester carboxylesterase
MRALRGLIAIIAGGGAGVIVAGGVSPPMRSIEARSAPEPCVVAGLNEPARCTTIAVRESAAGNRAIDLRVIILPARIATPLADPIFPLVGGPGQGAADLAAAMAQRFAAYRDDRDLVLVDQRGTGASNGLTCVNDETAGQLMGLIFDPARLAACRDTLSARADLAHYTTSETATDYEHVFDQLGYDTVNIVGTSYGSRLGLEIARRLPRRVRTLTIEGVVPATFDWPSSGAPDAEAALTALIDDCEADAGCATAYPRFRQDIDVAFARLRREPATAMVRDPATGAVGSVPFNKDDLAYATRGILYGIDAMSLPLWYRRAAEGDFSALAQFYVTRARALDAQIARGLLLGVYCAEDLPYVDWPRAAVAAEPTRIGSYLLDQYRRACEGWPRGAVDASFRQPVISTVPALIMSGRRDPVTPPRTAIDVARGFTRSRVLIWPRGGHGTDGLVSGSCRASIQREFLRTADPAAPSLACVTLDPSWRWVF